MTGEIDRDHVIVLRKDLKKRFIGTRVRSRSRNKDDRILSIRSTRYENDQLSSIFVPYNIFLEIEFGHVEFTVASDSRKIKPMKIKSVTLHRVVIPFKTKFTHASNSREQADNIVVQTVLEDGTTGYGEGLPRTYVTGETQESVIATLSNLSPDLFNHDISSIEELYKFLETEIFSEKNFKQARGNNTARCALELSLLDAYCRYFKCHFHDVAKLALKNPRALNKRSTVRYCGVVSLESFRKAVWSAVKMNIFGFAELKVKLGPDFDLNIKCVKWMRKLLGKKVELHVDANEAWTLESAVKNIEALAPYNIGAVEQPLPHARVNEMPELQKRSSLPLMLDESLSSLADAKASLESKNAKMWNIRLSKCGGFVLALQLAEFARANGIGYQLGCLVGESGILSAAGRHFASIDPSYKYLEGSFDRHLLGDNLIKEDITFRRKGLAPSLNGFGLGVTVLPEKIAQYSVHSSTLFP